MKKILFYYPSNKRSVQIETTLGDLKGIGYDILFLSTCKKGDLHTELEKLQIPTYSHVIKSGFSFTYYSQHIHYLANFCKTQKVDILYANLQHANFIAVFAQFLMKTRVIAFRHHFKFNKGNFGIPLKVNRNEQFFDKVINRLAKEVVVPSYGVYNGIIEYESIDKKKLKVIPYLYDFSKYDYETAQNTKDIKQTYPAQLRIIMVARLIPFKRHILIFPVIKKLIDEGFDIKMFVLDEGPEKGKLSAYIQENQLEENIVMLGFRKDFLQYMAASDLIIHPSITEASNSVIKEIGLLEKVVAVCRGVGDFDEYIEDGKNGFLMDIAQPQIDAEIIIRKVYDNENLRKQLGIAIRKTIIDKFSKREKTIEMYRELFENPPA